MALSKTLRGFLDLRRLFRDLRHRHADPLDDGRVEGRLSLADKRAKEDAEAGSSTSAGKTASSGHGRKFSH